MTVINLPPTRPARQHRRLSPSLRRLVKRRASELTYQVYAQVRDQLFAELLELPEGLPEDELAGVAAAWRPSAAQPEHP